MRRRSSRIYFPVFFLLLASLSLPTNFTLSMKSSLIALIAPLWGSTQTVFTSKEKEEASQKFERFELENQLLRNRIQDLEEILRVEKEWGAVQGVPAHVIYRPSEYWSSSLWIDVGSAINAGKKQPIIAKNSPVVLGTTVVGVIDHVEEKRSRVRLITDPALVPSVRVLRDTQLLAKGELRGSIKTQWRQRSGALRGTGFNYDYPDEEGPARDLRSGDLAQNFGSGIKSPLIETGDLLITTGMDGVFPKGLRVARVSKIHPLKEGDYYYEIEAISCLNNLDDLHLIYVLPAL